MHAFISHQMLFRTPICRRSSFPKESQPMCIKFWVAAKKGKGQHIEHSLIKTTKMWPRPLNRARWLDNTGSIYSIFSLTATSEI